MQTFYLKPLWNKTVSVSVGASVEVCENFIAIDFAVKEPVKCFCQSKEQDGEAVWEDSCVEVFLEMLNAGGYANFEFNSKGVCYAARGKDRQNRTELSKSEYAAITRKPSRITTENDFYRWTLSVQIPIALLGAGGNASQIEGNLCKCADLAAEPHYLAAFPINTKTPDFHRPEFFQSLGKKIVENDAIRLRDFL
ncbi:MAG: carbohydrate-binding family 9-like protein [Fibromonadales bacterium]|nr:carbohydrate-binding family 9-like protein [Fibromonadales bacterium]